MNSINNETNSLNTNFNKNQNENLNIEAVNNNPADFYHSQMMEKDKIIFDYSKLLKDSERKIEQLKKQQNSKEESQINLKDEIKEYQHKLKNLEINLSKKDDSMLKSKQNYEEKLIKQEEQKKQIQDKVNELTKNIETLQIREQTLLLELKKIEKSFNKVKTESNEKSYHLQELDKTVEELKKECKSIAHLKKILTDQEMLIKQLQNQIEKERRENESFIKEKEELEVQVNNVLSDNKINKELCQINNNLKSENDGLRQELEKMKSEYLLISNKLKQTVKDSETFFGSINTDINDLLTFIELIDENRLNTNYNYQSENNTNNNSIPCLIIFIHISKSI